MGAEDSELDADVSRTVIESFSVSPAGGRIDPSPPVVVLVPYGSSLEKGFHVARGLVATGQRTRLVGMGVTLTSTWPTWVRGAAGLECTELWAYRARSPILATRKLKSALDAWIRDVLRDASPRMDPSSAFFGVACLRVFQKLFITFPEVLGVAARHGKATLHVTDPEWLGLAALESLVRETGGTVLGGAARGGARKHWRGSLATYGTLGLAATILDQVRDYALSRPTLNAIDIRRRRGAPDVDYWLVLHGDAPRANLAVVDAVALPIVGKGESVGVLLQSSAMPGERLETAGRRRIGSELWVGLGALREHVDQCVLDQVVCPAEPFRFAIALFDATARSLRTLRRLADTNGVLRIEAVTIDLSSQVRELAKLATIDVTRSALSEAAVERFASGADLTGKTVVFSTTGALAGGPYVNMALRRAGARTVEVAHGSLGTGEPGAREPQDKLTCVWTGADARVLAPLGEPTLVAGMPRRLRTRSASRALPQNVLIVSNYLHRDYGDPSPLEPFNVELLATSRAIDAVFGPEAKVRWRPHPADHAAAIDRLASRFPNVTRSGEKFLEGDVLWADLIVISMSSSTYEVLFAGVPVFVQVTPDYEATPAAAFIDASRRFFTATQLKPLLVQFRESIRSGSGDILRPERVARVALFGDGEEPRPIFEVLEGAI